MPRPARATRRRRCRYGAEIAPAASSGALTVSSKCAQDVRTGMCIDTRTEMCTDVRTAIRWAHATHLFESSRRGGHKEYRHVYGRPPDAPSAVPTPACDSRQLCGLDGAEPVHLTASSWSRFWGVCIRMRVADIRWARAAHHLRARRRGGQTEYRHVYGRALGVPSAMPTRIGLACESRQLCGLDCAEPVHLTASSWSRFSGSLYSPTSPRSSGRARTLGANGRSTPTALYRLYTGCIPVLYRPYTGPIPVVCRPYTGPIPVVYWPYTGPMPALCRALYRPYTGPYTGPIPALYRLYTSPIPAVYRSYTGRIPALYRLYTGRIPALYRPYTGLYTGPISVVYRAYTGCIPVRIPALYRALYRPYTGPIPALYRPYTGHNLNQAACTRRRARGPQAQARARLPR